MHHNIAINTQKCFMFMLRIDFILLVCLLCIDVLWTNFAESLSRITPFQHLISTQNCVLWEMSLLQCTGFKVDSKHSQLDGRCQAWSGNISLSTFTFQLQINISGGIENVSLFHQKNEYQRYVQCLKCNRLCHCCYHNCCLIVKENSTRVFLCVICVAHGILSLNWAAESRQYKCP